MSVITCLTFSGMVPFENVNILATVARQLVFQASNQQLRIATAVTKLILLDGMTCILLSGILC